MAEWSYRNDCSLICQMFTGSWFLSEENSDALLWIKVFRILHKGKMLASLIFFNSLLLHAFPHQCPSIISLLISGFAFMCPYHIDIAVIVSTKHRSPVTMQYSKWSTNCSRKEGIRGVHDPILSCSSSLISLTATRNFILRMCNTKSSWHLQIGL